MTVRELKKAIAAAGVSDDAEVFMWEGGDYSGEYRPVKDVECSRIGKDKDGSWMYEEWDVTDARDVLAVSSE